MKILKLELVGYKRMMLNHINHLVFTPQQKLQLILGSNGSGKSSMLSELSPLPATSIDFPNGGYKLIEISHNNNHYVLKHTFNNPGNRYSFIKNDEELNQAGGIRMYLELVKQEFNLTPEIHDVMLGNKTFNNMSVAERRAWFTRLSDVDYTYALGYFKRLTSHIRDLEGAVKTMESRLVQENEKVLNEEQEAKVREDIRNLHTAIDGLLNRKTQVPQTTYELDTEISKIDTDISNISKSILKLRTDYYKNSDNINFYDLVVYEENTSNLIRDSLNKQEVLSKLIERDHQIVKSIEDNNVSSIESLDTEIFDYIEKSNDLAQSLTLEIDFNSPKESLDTLNSIYSTIQDISSQLPIDKDKKITREAYIKLKEDHHKTDTQLHQLDKYSATLDAKKKELEHLKEHNETTCPKCSYTWYRGYDEEAYRKISQDVITTNEAIVKLHEKMEDLNDTLEVMSNNINLYTRLSELMSHTAILKPLWDYITPQVRSNPRSIVLVAEKASNDLKKLIQRNIYQDKVKELTKLKEDILSTKQQDISEKKKYLEDLDAQYTKEIHHFNELKAKQNKIHYLMEIMNKVHTSASNLSELLKKRDNKFSDLYTAVIQETINECIQKLRLELTEKEQLISKLDIQKALVADIQKQIDSHKETIQVGKLAIKELSPNEGLIARGLTNFINVFVAKINQYIKKIWSYRLELVPVLPDEDGIDLDYKFAVKVGDENTIPDISKASTAMKEVIDLAFKIVAMEYLGLKHYPLYLDEIGANMDYKHKKDAFMMINNIATMSDFSQIFLISHNEHSYSTLSNSDITVLCQANIVPPRNAVFNNCCEIT